MGGKRTNFPIHWIVILKWFVRILISFQHHKLFTIYEKKNIYQDCSMLVRSLDTGTFTVVLCCRIVSVCVCTAGWCTYRTCCCMQSYYWVSRDSVSPWGSVAVRTCRTTALTQSLSLQNRWCVCQVLCAFTPKSASEANWPAFVSACTKKKHQIVIRRQKCLFLFIVLGIKLAVRYR